MKSHCPTNIFPFIFPWIVPSIPNNRQVSCPLYRTVGCSLAIDATRLAVTATLKHCVNHLATGSIVDLWGFDRGVFSVLTRPGKYTKNYGTSPFLMGKLTINEFSCFFFLFSCPLMGLLVGLYFLFPNMKIWPPTFHLHPVSADSRFEKICIH